MKILFLDDSPHRHKKMLENSIGFSVVGVFSAQEAIAAMSKDEEFDLIMLDHDLDMTKQGLILENEEDGRFVARWMVLNNKYKTTSIIVHSLNAPAAAEMVRMFDKAGYDSATALPLAWTMITKTAEGNILFDISKKSKDAKDYQ